MRNVVQNKLFQSLKNLLIAYYPQRFIGYFRVGQIKKGNLVAVRSYSVHNALISDFAVRKV